MLVLLVLLLPLRSAKTPEIETTQKNTNPSNACYIPQYQDTLPAANQTNQNQDKCKLPHPNTYKMTLACTENLIPHSRGIFGVWGGGGGYSLKIQLRPKRASHISSSFPANIRSHRIESLFSSTIPIQPCRFVRDNSDIPHMCRIQYARDINQIQKAFIDVCAYFSSHKTLPPSCSIIILGKGPRKKNTCRSSCLLMARKTFER